MGRSYQGRYALRWLISPILDKQILGHQGHRKVGPVESCSCASFCHLRLSSAASCLLISKSCAALLVVSHHAAWFSASCSQCLGLMHAGVNWPFSWPFQHFLGAPLSHFPSDSSFGIHVSGIQETWPDHHCLGMSMASILGRLAFSRTASLVL